MRPEVRTWLGGRESLTRFVEARENRRHFRQLSACEPFTTCIGFRRFHPFPSFSAFCWRDVTQDVTRRWHFVNRRKRDPPPTSSEGIRRAIRQNQVTERLG